MAISAGNESILDRLTSGPDGSLPYVPGRSQADNDAIADWVAQGAGRGGYGGPGIANAAYATPEEMKRHRQNDEKLRKEGKL